MDLQAERPSTRLLESRQAVGTALIGRTVECQVHSLPDGKLKATHVVLKSPAAHAGLFWPRNERLGEGKQFRGLDFEWNLDVFG